MFSLERSYSNHIRIARRIGCIGEHSIECGEYQKWLENGLADFLVSILFSSPTLSRLQAQAKRFAGLFIRFAQAGGF